MSMICLNKSVFQESEKTGMCVKGVYKEKEGSGEAVRTPVGVGYQIESRRLNVAWQI